MRGALRLLAFPAIALGLALALVPSTAAGSATDPEVTDDAGDQELADAGFDGIDLVAAWVEAEGADNFTLAIQASAAIAGDPGTTFAFAFHLTGNGTEAVAGATVDDAG
ncbi:MAG TPA: hypothetical protein VI796_00040, partial [Candidatus Thermoplasmatota archaeon]|nr:hypothetical protein [Candidatus Thermoplasmatota archaeon]